MLLINGAIYHNSGNPILTIEEVSKVMRQLRAMPPLRLEHSRSEHSRRKYSRRKYSRPDFVYLYMQGDDSKSGKWVKLPIG